MDTVQQYPTVLESCHSNKQCGPLGSFPGGLQKLRDEYTNADEETKRLLEKRYGKQTIQAAVAECLTKEWLDEFSKTCPDCGASIQVGHSFL